MLIVTGLIEIAEKDVASARDAALQMMAASQKEQGCLTYEFSQVLDSATRFRVYEEWESRAALEAHFQTDHMTAFRKTLGDLTITHREIYMVTDGRREPL